MKSTLQPWLQPKFWRVKFPIMARAPRVAILVVVNVVVAFGFIIIYDKTEDEPIAGGFVALVVNALTFYAFLAVTQHNNKNNPKSL